MFRQIAKKVIQSQSPVPNAQAMMRVVHRTMSSSIAATFANSASPASTSTIADILVDMTFVDPKGARRKVKGMVGKCNSVCWSMRTFL
jgi:hypothetical protein